MTTGGEDGRGSTAEAALGRDGPGSQKSRGNGARSSSGGGGSGNGNKISVSSYAAAVGVNTTIIHEQPDTVSASLWPPDASGRNSLLLRNPLRIKKKWRWRNNCRSMNFHDDLRRNDVIFQSGSIFSSSSSLTMLLLFPVSFKNNLFMGNWEERRRLILGDRFLFFYSQKRIAN